jgi:MSHA biogenesis protein MshM
MVKEKQGIIGRSMVISGDVECHSSIVVEGQMNGTFTGTDLHITDSGHVSGRIIAENIECFGRIEGDIATHSLVLRDTGCHVGTVKTSDLTVEPGAILDCALQSGQKRVQKQQTPQRVVKKATVFDLSTCIHAFQEEMRPCCMDVLWSDRKELYNNIVDLLDKGKPLIKVTGESGSGKSLLALKVQNSLPDNYEIFLASEQTGAVAALVQGVAADIGIDTATFPSQKELIIEIKTVLKEKKLGGKKIVLLVDDAELMYPATMEGVIRLLTTAYGEDQGEALQMILFGTRELESQMVTTTVEYFEDETNCQIYLEPLTIKDTAEYLRLCLQLAIKEAEVDCIALLPYESINRIHSASRGNVGKINELADKALQAAHADGATAIEPVFIK